MRDTDSDKTTVVAVVVCLVSILVSLLSNLRALVNHGVALVELHFWDYLIAAFNVYAAFTIGRDRKLPESYPYGVAGIGLMTLVLLIRIVAHWVARSAATLDFFWASMTVVSIGSSLLILAEGARWFRKQIRLT